MKMKTSAIAATLVTACLLLVGCGANPFASPLGSNGPDGEATPHKTNTKTNAPTDDENSGADTVDPASCLVGTWEEDMKVFTDTTKKSTGTFDDGTKPINISWTGGAFLQFDQKDTFSVWTENLSISFELEDTKTRMTLDANGGGGYANGGDVIQWYNGAAVDAYLQVFEDKKLVHEGPDDSFGDFSNPSPFTCTKDTLEVNLEGDTRTPPRVFQRIADKAPKN